MWINPQARARNNLAARRSLLPCAPEAHDCFGSHLFEPRCRKLRADCSETYTEIILTVDQRVFRNGRSTQGPPYDWKTAMLNPPEGSSPSSQRHIGTPAETVAVEKFGGSLLRCLHGFCRSPSSKVFRLCARRCIDDTTVPWTAFPTFGRQCSFFVKSAVAEVPKFAERTMNGKLATQFKWGRDSSRH